MKPDQAAMRSTCPACLNRLSPAETLSGRSTIARWWRNIAAEAILPALSGAGTKARALRHAVAATPKVWFRAPRLRSRIFA